MLRFCVAAGKLHFLLFGTFFEATMSLCSTCASWSSVPARCVPSRQLLYCANSVIDVLQAGKTSLVKALVSASSSTEHIKLKDRSAALDISTQKLPLPGSGEHDTIHCRLWDFGGHEVFYLSHTMHFTGQMHVPANVVAGG